MPAIYTDQSGQGYDLEQLRTAYSSGKFANDPLAGRVPDILAQYGSAAGASSSAPTNRMPNEFPTVDPSQLQIDAPGRIAKQPVPNFTPPQQTPSSGGIVDPYDRSNAANLGSGGTYNTPAPGNDANQIYGWFSTYQGKSATPQDVTALLNSGKSLGQIQNEIANSPDAQTFASRPGGNLNQPGSAGAPASRGGGDSSQALLINAALQRLSQLQQPIDHTNEDLYTKYALDRVGTLGGAPFSDSQSAALLTKNLEPLTQARDQAKQQAAQDLSRRGFTPQSGVFQQRMSQIDQAYERGVAGVTNTLNVQGIDQAQKNAQQQLQILDSLVTMGKMSRQEADQRSQEIVQTAGIPLSSDQSVLQSLNQSAGNGNDASSIIQSLLSLGQSNQRGTIIQNQNDQQNAAAMGQVIGYILNNHSAFGF